MAYKAFIFDLDGTLADTVESIAHCANQSLEAVGQPAQPVEKYNYFAGDGSVEMLKRALISSGDEKLEKFERLLDAYRPIFQRDCMYHVRPFAGIVETLGSLKRKGMKLAVLSNKPHNGAIQVVNQLFGEGGFDYIQGLAEDMVRKPDPAGALKIAAYFQIDPSECVYVGDTDTDMQTGTAAKMYTVGVTWGFRTREELEANHADLIIDRAEELLEI